MKWFLLAVAALFVAIIAFFAFGYRNATAGPVVVQYRMPLSGLPPGKTIRIVQLSDLHASPIDMPEARLSAIVARANALHPDLIVLTGDYTGGKLIDWPGMRLEDALRPLAALRAPLGVYAILGNHDVPYWMRYVLARQGGPRLLVNEHVDLGPLALVGLQSIARGANLPRAAAGIPPGKPILLLLHEGDYLRLQTYPLHNPAVALAGHTHGGQVVLPLLGSLGDIWGGRPLCRRGLCRINGWPLEVSSGLGTSVLPIRYGVPPEIVVVTLYPAAGGPPG